MKLLIWSFFSPCTFVFGLDRSSFWYRKSQVQLIKLAVDMLLREWHHPVWNESIVDVYIYIRLMIDTFLPCKTTGQKNKQVPKGLWSTGPNSEVMPARRRLNLAEWIFRTLMLILFTYVQSWKSQSHCFLMSKQHKRMWKKIQDLFILGCSFTIHLFIWWKKKCCKGNICRWSPRVCRWTCKIWAERSPR